MAFAARSSALPASPGIVSRCPGGGVAAPPRPARTDEACDAFPRDRGRLARFYTPVGLRPTCGRAARAPRDNPSARRLSWDPSARRLSPGPRAARPLQLTGGPAAHLRAGRPRSQEPLRSATFPGTAGGSPASTHRWACRPLAGGSPALPGETPPLGDFPGTAGGSPASTHRWAFGPLAGGPPALPGTPAPLGAFPRDCGRLARFNSPVGLRPTCGRDARGPGNPSARRAPRDGARPGSTVNDDRAPKCPGGA